jgi:negative regulator of replication initiation
MRTTINVDDDLLALVKQYAESRSVGLGKAVSDLVRRGLTAVCPTKAVNGLEVFDLPPDSPVVTSGKVRELEAELK